MGRHLGLHRLGQQTLQRVNGIAKAEDRQLLPRRIDVELHPGRGHRATSAKRA